MTCRFRSTLKAEGGVFTVSGAPPDKGLDPGNDWGGVRKPKGLKASVRGNQSLLPWGP